MTVEAFSGSLFKNPTTVGGIGGFELLSIGQRLIRFDTGMTIIEEHEGENWEAYSEESDRPPKLHIPLHDCRAGAVLEMLRPFTVNGTAISPSKFARKRKLPTIALLIVPIDPSKNYFYAPFCQLAADSQSILHWSPTDPRLPGEARFICSKPAASNLDAWMIDTAANIAAAYGLGGLS